MAVNVFGNPITVSTLHGMVEFAKKKENEISRLDLARVALDMKNARGNDINACKYVRNIARGLQEEPLTLCVIYNATGDTLSFDSYKDWEGHIAHTPFPVTIANGQWAGFAHINPSGVSKPSKGAVKYRGMNDDNEIRYFLFAWDNPWERKEDTHNKAFTAVIGGGNKDVWKEIEDCLDQDGGLVYENTRSEYSSVCIGDVRKGAIVEAIFTLEGADL